MSITPTAHLVLSQIVAQDEDIFTRIEGYANDTRNTIGIVIGVVGLIAAIIIVVQKRFTVGSWVMAIFVGSLAAVLTALITDFSGSVEETLTSSSAQHSVVQPSEPQASAPGSSGGIGAWS